MIADFPLPPYLQYYVDIDTVDVGDISITPEDPRWVGAWWIGFLLSGTEVDIVRNWGDSLVRHMDLGESSSRVEEKRRGRSEICVSGRFCGASSNAAITA